MEMLQSNIVDLVVCVQRLSPQEKNVSYWFLKVVDIGNQRQRNTCDQLLIYMRPWSLLIQMTGSALDQFLPG
jgi:hypothetical protein